MRCVPEKTTLKFYSYLEIVSGMLQQIYIKHRCLLWMHAAYTRHSVFKNLKAADESDVVVFIKQTTIENLYSDWRFPFSHSTFLFSLPDLILAEGNSSSLSINQGTAFITGPYLDGNGISNITTQISTHAYLPCKVSCLIESARDNCCFHSLWTPFWALKLIFLFRLFFVIFQISNEF